MKIRNKPILGLLGGIGSGKSAVAAELVKHGGWLINADHLGHEALRQTETKRRVVAHFGDEILDPLGDIDRRRLGAKVFASERQLRDLEAIVFPYIGRRIREEIDMAQRRADVRFVVLDAAVMFEAGWSNACDKVIFVDAPLEVRLQRVQKKRGWTEADLQAREGLQLPLEEKRRRADATIDNGTTLQALADHVSALLRTWGIA